MNGLDLIQFAVLLLLMGFIYRNFGPGSHAADTSSAILVVSAGSFALMWLTSMRARQ